MCFQDLKDLFEFYDADGSGTLDYKEFSSILFDKQDLRE
jgi:Ca2+-binding EF-hand superfamily protein